MSGRENDLLGFLRAYLARPRAEREWAERELFEAVERASVDAPKGASRDMNTLTQEQASNVTEGVSALSISLWPLFAHALNVAYPEWAWTVIEKDEMGYAVIECNPREPVKPPRP